ncbi:MAG: LysM peptidoglycan-binding domain-containing protein, partial [Anaerolineae bacterium]|nr:LysM peptidoglycan-binding domain-containing protein [Anaerolineae bacterium]
LGGAFAPPFVQRYLPGVAGVAAASSPSRADDTAANWPATDLRLDLLLVRADDARRAGDWGECVDLLTEAVAIEPGSAHLRERLYEAHANYGWRLLVQRRFVEAKAEFEAALQIRPDGIGPPEGLRLLANLTVSPAIPVASAAACPTGCRPVSAPACPTACPPVSVPVCPTACPPVCTAACPASGFPTCPSAPTVPLACPTVCPGGKVKVHVVQRGDNIFRLATSFETTVRVLMEVNGLTTTRLRVGQVLVIP